MQPSDKGGKKVYLFMCYIFGLGHMTKMAPCPYIVKRKKKKKKNNSEVYINGDLELTMMYLMARPKFVP